MECAEPSSSGLPVIDTLPAAESLISEVLDAGDDAGIRLRWVADQTVRLYTDLPAAISSSLLFRQTCWYTQSNRALACVDPRPVSLAPAVC